MLKLAPFGHAAGVSAGDIGPSLTSLEGTHELEKLLKVNSPITPLEGTHELEKRLKVNSPITPLEGTHELNVT